MAYQEILFYILTILLFFLFREDDILLTISLNNVTGILNVLFRLYLFNNNLITFIFSDNKQHFEFVKQ